MHCLVVTLSQEGLKALSPPCLTMRKVLDNHGVVTGKTAEKQDKCILELSREHIPAFTPYTLHLFFVFYASRQD